MIDMQGTDEREPIADLRVLQNELKLYKATLSRKPVLVAANKMDEPKAPESLKVFEKKCKHPLYPISCVSDEGFDQLKAALLEAVLKVRAQVREDDKGGVGFIGMQFLGTPVQTEGKRAPDVVIPFVHEVVRASCGEQGEQ